MMNYDNLLDAWSDFSKISHLLNDDNESIVILLGASWCHKCDPIKQTVFNVIEQGTPGIHWLWLDLEDHCEFLGHYLPESIPLVWVYQGEHLVRYGELHNELNRPLDFFEFIQSIPLVTTPEPDSDIRLLLLASAQPAYQL